MLDEASRREQFPTLAGMTYLNTAAEGIPPLVVGEALAEYFRHKQQGSPGREAHMAELAATHQLTAALYGLSAEEIGICSCSSEAYNLAALALRLQPGDEVVITDLDFPAGQTPWLQEGCPATVRLWQSREGALRIEDLVPLLTPRTRLVTASLVSYYNGFTLSLQPLVEAVRRHSPAQLSIDVTQALGRIPLHLEGVDLIVSSTHKWICATHGGGLVGVPKSRETAWTVPAGGWFHLDRPFERQGVERAVSKPGAVSFAVGMPNFPAIYAIRAALEYISAVGVAQIDATARPLVQACIAGLAELPVELLTPREDEALAGILAFRHPEMERLFAQLAAEEIHVMHSAGRIRISLHGYNTLDEVERFLAALRRLLS